MKKAKKIWSSLRFWRILGLTTTFLTLALFLSIYGWNIKYNELSEYNTAMENHIKYYSSKSFSWDGHLIMLDPQNKNVKENRIIESSPSSTSSSSTSNTSSSSSEETLVSSSSSSSTIADSNQFDPSKYEVVDFAAWNHDDIEKGKFITVSGKVLQHSEGTNSHTLRVAVDDDYDKVILAEISNSSYKNVIAENDSITLYGLNAGLTSYETVLGASKTLPSLIVTRYENSY